MATKFLGRSADVISFRPQATLDAQRVRQQIEGVVAILHAIDAGELLVALPECAIARAQHLSALTLLTLAEKELMAIQDVISDWCL